MASTTFFIMCFASVEVVKSCDAAGMSSCNQAYLSSVTSGSGDSCQAVETMLACLNTACTGCDDAVKQQFNAIVSPIKSGGSCGASGACANTTICTAADPLTCGTESSGAANLSPFWFIVALVFFVSL